MYNEFLSQNITSLYILAGSLILAFVVSFSFKKIIPRITSKTKSDLDEKLAEKLSSPIFFLVLLGGVHLAIEESGYVFQYVDKLILTIGSLILLVTAVRILMLLIERYESKAYEKTKVAEQMVPLLKNIARLSVYVIGLMFIFIIWNIDITPILASAGILGLAVAFAAQDTVANFFGGIAIFFDKPFKIGDRIQLDSGEQGFVTKIGVRTSRIRTFDNTELSIPNATLANSKVINWNNPETKTKLTLNIGVAYGSDPEKTKQVILDEANNCKEVLNDPKPEVYFTKMGDFALNFALLVWLEKPLTYGATDALNRAIYNRLNKEGISIPFPTRTIHMKK